MRQSELFPNDTDLPGNLGAPAERALAGVQIKYLKDLTKWTEKEIADLHGVGPTAIVKLKAVLKSKGWSFKK